jgi:hypothetical protein
MAEAEMNRRLDGQAMDALATVTLVNGLGQVPCDFAGVKAFSVPGSPNRKLEYVRSDAFDNLSPCTGGPYYYTILGDQFIVSFTATTPVQARLRYRKRLDGLSSANICNWLSDRFPDAYIYGVLKHAGIFLGDERLPLWSAAFDAAIDAVNADANSHDHGSTLQLQHSGAV